MPISTIFSEGKVQVIYFFQCVVCKCKVRNTPSGSSASQSHPEIAFRTLQLCNADFKAQSGRRKWQQYTLITVAAQLFSFSLSILSVPFTRRGKNRVEIEKEKERVSSTTNVLSVAKLPPESRFKSIVCLCSSQLRCGQWVATGCASPALQRRQ